MGIASLQYEFTQIQRELLVIKDTIYNTAQNIYLLSPIHILQFGNKK